MLTKEQEKQIKDAVYEAWKSTACTQSDMFLAAIKKYDEIVNPPVVDDTNWEEVIENLELAFAHCHPLDWQEAKALQKAIDFIKANTNKS